ncbi:unnamed protein product [Euphydryas editha]|uniref:Uncharacterized protein n=1 Tax=Euphydryas editha TaxID=104508 RepID=A0AAU9UNK9_EUPED|nr:unnamed protein product [Euphydryas editha]
MIVRVNKISNSTKSEKEIAPDEIPGDILKLLAEENIQIILRLFNGVYRTGMIPSDQLFSTFVPFLKFNIARKCGKYRTISLMSHVFIIE